VLSKEERAKSKADKKAETYARKHPAPWYKSFVWVAPVFEKSLDKKGKEIIKVKTRGYLKLANEPGTKISSGNRVYEVQKSGALKCLNKNPSKRDLHREQA
jgi:hypothetical protein